MLRGSAFVVSATVTDKVLPEEVAAEIEFVVDGLAKSVTDEECDRARAEWATPT
jgi:hypothetical protein